MTDRRSHPAFPQPPVDLIAVAVGGHQVILAWAECESGGLGYRIERAGGTGTGVPFVKIGRVGPHVTAFRDGAVMPRTTYSYRVLARNVSGDSSPSNVAEVTTPQAGTVPAVDGE